MDELAVVVDYDPHWPERYAAEARLLGHACAAAQETTAVIQHVGSTAVPGLAAKPVIDICIEIDTYPPTVILDQALAAIGYQGLGEAGVPGRHFYRKGIPRLFHLHCTPLDGTVARSQLAFRARLRARPDLAARYAQAKKSISGQFGIDRADYVRLKEPLIQEILAEREC